VSLSQLIRDLRSRAELSQTQLAERVCIVSGRPTVTRDEIKRWESGRVIPSRYWLTHLADALNAPADCLVEEARLTRMERRAFLSLTALTAVHGKLAAELTASIAARDDGPLTSVQTTHGADLVIASFTDRRARANLQRWMYDGSTPILRVNAAGILAKTPGQTAATDVIRVLENDGEARQLYLTAVAARVCALPWASAERLAKGHLPTSTERAHYLATRLSRETVNPRDVGARWCSAMLLRDLAPTLGQIPQ
jgi:transcriptional regulator with XRE-family HTH domain